MQEPEDKKHPTFAAYKNHQYEKRYEHKKIHIRFWV